MAGGNKKKKKTAINPARGFSTVSTASKAKDALKEDDNVGPSIAATPDDASSLPETPHAETAGAAPDRPRELHQLNPDELEAQLELSELQQFVEQNAVKVRKESSRQVSRLQTDKRLLRGQADYLALRDWLPDEIVQVVLDLTLGEIKSEIGSAKKQRQPRGDDLLAKVWTLHLSLLGLDIPITRVREAIGSIIENPPLQDDSSLVWGLSTALHWLALHCEPSELYGYENQKPSSLRSAKDEPPGNGGDFPDESDESASGKVAGLLTSNGRGSKGNNNTSDDGPIVSDVDSDAEPEELLSTYVRTKARLYEINPSFEARPPKKGAARRAQLSYTEVAPSPSALEKKLQKKLRKIASDLLFDRDEAEARWVERRTEEAKRVAERKRLQIADQAPTADQAAQSDDSPVDSLRSNGVSDDAQKMGQDLLKECEDQDDADMLGGMFNALPGVNDSSNGVGDAGAPQEANVTVRHFGVITGISPKRVLEEACKARDADVKLAYKLISPNTYASRHSITIIWNKEQEAVEGTFLTTVDMRIRGRTLTLSTKLEATPDKIQSEAYVATVALFVLFSGSPKEEKSHLKLPPAFRDLWDELALAKREHVEAEDRQTVKQLRELIEEKKRPEDDDDDEVVFNANSRNRTNPASGTSTPVPAQDRYGAGQPVALQQLKDIWTAKTTRPSYQRILATRMNLPMFQFKDVALEAITRHQITILRGQTGSGKSTQVPAFILEHELSQGRHCKIYCTQPRRISAISLAQRVSEEMGEQKGDLGTARSLVGYAIRLESHSVASTRLIYATTGIVLRMLENSEGLGDTTHLVIDEVHERSIDTDFLLILLRSLLLRKPDLKIVLMSATVDAHRFSEYLDGAPIIEVPGRTFPVQAMFLEDAIEVTGHANDDASSGNIDDEEDRMDDRTKVDSQELTSYSKKTRTTLASYDEYRIDYNLILKLLHKVAFDADYQQFSKAVLVFLPGIAEIRQLNDMILCHPPFQHGWRIYPLHSSFASEDQQAAFEIPPNGIRKIVLATNIAETGITIPDVTCVIDTGKHKEMRFDERRQMSRLVLSFIARANAKQRRGRAGRVQEGICFHLFTKLRHDELMAEQQTPEMLRLSLQDLVMRVKICKLGDIEHALSQALDPPSSRNIRRAIDALMEADALTSSEELTPLGLQLAKLPLDAQLGKLILLGSIFGCLDFALTAAATLTSKPPFLSPMHAKKQADTVRLGYKRGNSDLLTSYNAYCAWRKICTTPGMPEYQFCNKNFLSPQNLANIEDLKGQLLTALADAGFVQLGPDERAALHRLRMGSRQRNFVAVPSSYCRSDDDDTITTSVIAWSFYPKIVKQDGKGWRNIANNQSLALHPTSVNKLGVPPDVKLLSFYSIMQSAARFTNAQESSPAPEVSLVLLAGDAVFYMYAGVVVVDGNRLRLKVKDWRTMVVLKTLRARLKEVLARSFKNPGRELPGKYKTWMEIVERIFETQKKKS